MSIGNLKDYGNKGNNFPWQRKVLQGLSLSQARNLTEETLSNDTPERLASDINTLLGLNPNHFVVSKSIVYDSAGAVFVAFITLAEL